MQYHTIGDFMKRTLANLSLIEDKHRCRTPGTTVYEVTQLINSLVLPLELLVNKQYVLENARVSGGSSLRKKIDEFDLADGPRFEGMDNTPRPASLSEWALRLRNAVAHFNITFIAGSETAPITHVVMWDKDPHQNNRVVWKGKTTVQDLSHFLRQLLLAVEDSELGDILMEDKKD